MPAARSTNHSARAGAADKRPTPSTNKHCARFTFSTPKHCGNLYFITTAGKLLYQDSVAAECQAFLVRAFCQALKRVGIENANSCFVWAIAIRARKMGRSA